MAVGITAGATVAAAGISAGASIYNSSQQQDAAKAAGKQPKVVPYKPPDVNVGYDSYLKGVEDYGPTLQDSANTINAASNAGYRQQIAEVDPRLAQGIADNAENTAKINTIAGQYLRGEVSADVAGQVDRTSAYRALYGGYAGGPIGAGRDGPGPRAHLGGLRGQRRELRQHRGGARPVGGQVRRAAHALHLVRAKPAVHPAATPGARGFQRQLRECGGEQK